MRISYLTLALAAMFAVSAVSPAAPPKRSAKKKTAVKKSVRKIGAENGLVGIHLYDTGVSLLKKYGNPIDIQGVNIGGQAAGPSSGFGGPMGSPMGPGGMRGGSGVPGPMGPNGPGGGGAQAPTTDLSVDPESLLKIPPSAGAGAPPSLGVPGGPSGPSGPAGMSGPGGMPSMPGGPMGPGMPGGAGAGTGSGFSGRTVFTRWVYNRPQSRYAFILDKFNRIVQIEAIGLTDGKVRTARGIGFGAQFKQIITAYGAPDAYEISGNSLVIRYLVKHKVAFRLNRLGENKPHVVTGIVVAAGKA